MNLEKLRAFEKFTSKYLPEFSKLDNDRIIYCSGYNCDDSCPVNSLNAYCCSITDSELEELKILYPEYFI